MKKWVPVCLLILLSIFLSGAELAYALITNPYTVDKKPQVLFGDSASISTATSTYLGLENYATSSVGGYAHITFTYTHAGFDTFCCYAAYPPLLYITNVDPRATSTPEIRSMGAVYPLLPKPIPPGHETDWYFYDIQFDATGYTVIVKQAGETEVTNFHTEVLGLAEGDWVALANQYPNLSTHSMTFTPVPIISPVPPPEPNIDPVIIIPGIMGSAYKNGKLVIDPILHTYDDLIATLDENGYTHDVDLFTFPYEWRDSNVFSANLLDDKIEEVKEVCDCDKVDIVAHSMGGLVARSYIQSVDYDGDVDQVIFLGTPHRGAPTDYLRWEAGKFPAGRANILTELFFEAEALRNGYSTIFNYIHDKPILSVQELLPTFSYLKDKDTGILRTYPNNYPRNFFLESLNSNISSLLNSGVEVTNIIGNSGSDTIENIKVIPSMHSGLWEHGEPDGFYTVFSSQGFERGLGDETVTIFGATLDSLISNQEIQSTHQRIPTIAENRIFKILTGKDSITNIDTGINFSGSVLLLQLLSPIDFVITAPNDKKIGKNFSNATEYDEIPLAFYSGFQTDNEYITILNPLDGEYKVEVQGTGSGGEYGILTSYISEEFATTTETTGITKPNQITNLEVTVDNQNPENLITERQITLDVLLNDIKGAYELGWIKDKKTRDELIKKVQKIYKKGKKIDKKLAKVLALSLKLYKKDKINEQAYNLIKTDLEWLINN